LGGFLGLRAERKRVGDYDDGMSERVFGFGVWVLHSGVGGLGVFLVEYRFCSAPRAGVGGVFSSFVWFTLCLKKRDAITTRAVH
jgi:hypothetical protein